MERRRVEQGERQGAEIIELRQDLTNVSATVGHLAQTVQQGVQQAKDSKEIKALLMAALAGRE